MQVINTRCFGRFWPVSWTTTHLFGVPERFLWLRKPKVCLRVVHQHSPFWPILAHFMDYYSLFWDPRATLMVAEPQGALTYRSSTLTSLTILTRFIDYYSPFWGKEQFPWLLNPEVRLRAGH